jgi:hypothetical protein
MARKENEGYDACCAQVSSSPCDDGGENRTNKVCFASSSSWNCRRKSNSSAQIQYKSRQCPSLWNSRVLLPLLIFQHLYQVVIFNLSEHYFHCPGRPGWQMSGNTRSLDSKVRPALLTSRRMADDVVVHFRRSQLSASSLRYRIDTSIISSDLAALIAIDASHLSCTPFDRPAKANVRRSIKNSSRCFRFHGLVLSLDLIDESWIEDNSQPSCPGHGYRTHSPRRRFSLGR